MSKTPEPQIEAVVQLVRLALPSLRVGGRLACGVVHAGTYQHRCTLLDWLGYCGYVPGLIARGETPARRGEMSGRTEILRPHDGCPFITQQEHGEQHETETLSEC